MIAGTICDKCGDQMTNNPIQRENVLECIHYQCLKCGYCYETGLRYNRVIKQQVKFIRFNP